jgi:tetratricopeptide (TPR) repeat protein
MNTSSSKHAQIERYLNQEMTESERTAFDQQIAQDPDLRETLALYKSFDTALGPSSVNVFRGQVAAALKTQNKDAGSGFAELARRYWWLSAGVITLILTGLWYWIRINDRPEQIFARYFKPAISLDSVRGTAAPQDRLHEQAMTYYRSQNYPATIALLQSVIEADTTRYNSYAYLELAQLYLLNKEPNAALQALNRVVQGHADEKNWYEAMAFLQQNDLKSAIARLKTLAQTDNPYRVQALNLLNEIPK